jgi:hypothetical protein
MADNEQLLRKAVADAVLAGDVAVSQRAAPAIRLDIERAALDDKVRMHMADHPGTTYEAALDRILAADPTAGEPPPRDVQVFSRDDEMHERALELVADGLTYDDAIEGLMVLDEL